MLGGVSFLDGKLLVVVLDFGIVYGGYVYFFWNDYKLDFFKIIINYWIGEGLQIMFLKVFFLVLFNFDKIFNLFGYRVEEEYFNLVENG